MILNFNLDIRLHCYVALRRDDITYFHGMSSISNEYVIPRTLLIHVKSI